MNPSRIVLVDHAIYRAGKGAAGALVVSGGWNLDLYAPEAAGASHYHIKT